MKTPSTISDSEGLMAGFIPAVSAAPYAIAPERAEELTDKIFGGLPWVLDFKTGSATS
jgi:hypothetical protein